MFKKYTAMNHHAPTSFASPRARWTALALVSALALTACGGGSGSSSDESGTSTGTDASSGTSTGTGTSTSTGGTTATGTYGNLSAASLGNNASLNGAIPFPADNAWNTSVASAQVDSNSAAILSFIGTSRVLRSDLTVPYVVVSGTQAKVSVTFTDYASESDPGPYPIPSTTPTESGSDSHAIVVDKDNNRLYEVFLASKISDTAWTGASGAVFHLDSNNVRPTLPNGEHWTSADAAGLPIFPGLLRYDEASKGAGGIQHALRFTVPTTRKAYVPPATHAAGSCTATNCPPMGMRVRLKASYQIPSSFSTEAKAILTALKTYGMFLADNGSSYYMTGAPDSRWPSSLNSELGQISGADLEVVQMNGLVVR